MKLELVFPRRPPSTNNLYLTLPSGNRRVKTREYLAFIQLIQVICLRAGNFGRWREFARRPYRLTVELCEPTWLNKNGTAKKLDPGNFTKAAEDTICAIYGWEDQYCVEVIARKISGPSGECRVIFEFDGQILV